MRLITLIFFAAIFATGCSTAPKVYQKGNITVGPNIRDRDCQTAAFNKTYQCSKYFPTSCWEVGDFDRTYERCMKETGWQIVPDKK